MAHAVGDSLDLPLYGSHYLLTFPLLDADGDPVSAAAGLDSEVSIDLGTFGDCTNEAVELASNSGIYYLYLTGAEMTGKIITVRVQSSTSGAKTTVLSLSPRRLPILESGTAQAGAASTITLASGASSSNNYYNGLFVRLSNDSPSGVQYATRRILSYVGSTRVATVESAWGTNPSSATTYDILVPDFAAVAGWLGNAIPAPTVAGVPNVNAKTWNDLTTVALPLVPTAAGRTLDVSTGGEAGLDWANVGSPTTANALTGTTIASTQQVDVNTIKTQAVTCGAGVTVRADVGAAAAPGAANGMLIGGSNAATTFAGLTAGAFSCTTLTASGAVAFQSTFAVTTSTSLAALSCSTLTASGAVAFQSTFAVTTSTSLAALSCTTLTASGAVAFQSTFAVTTSTSLAALSCSTLTASGAVAFQSTFAVSSTVTFSAFTVTNATTLSGAVSLGSTLGVTGAVTLSSTLTTGAVTLNAFTVTNATTLSGAVSLGSTLGVTGTTTLAALTTTGTVTFNAFTVTNNFTVGGNWLTTGTTTWTGAATFTAGLTSNITGNLSGSVGSVTGTVNADLVKISGDSVDDNSATLTLKQLNITGGTDADAVVITATGEGVGVKVISDAGAGVYIHAFASAGVQVIGTAAGVSLIGSDGDANGVGLAITGDANGLTIAGGTDNSAVVITAAGEGAAINIGSVAGAAVFIHSSTSYGVQVTGTNAVVLAGDDDGGGRGLYISSVGEGISVNSTNGPALSLSSATNHGMVVAAGTGTSNDALRLVGGDDGGYDVNLITSGSIHGTLTGGVTLAANSIDATALSPGSGLKPLTGGVSADSSASSLTLGNDASAVDGFYVGDWLQIIADIPNTAAGGQVRRITAYDGTTKVATVDRDWTITPTALGGFYVVRAVPVETTAPGDSAGTTTLLSRLTSGRAGNLDSLDATVSSRLAPTVSGRTLDVSAAGEAGLDWANVGSPTTAVSLTGTTVATVTTVTTATNVTTVNGLAAGVITATSIASNALTAAKIAADAIGASQLAADAGTEIGTAVWATTTRILTAGTNIALAKGTGVTGFNDITGGSVTVTSNTDKTGYSLSQSFPSNFASLAVTPGGIVQADLQTIKTQTVTCAGGVTFPAATLASTTNLTAGTLTTVTTATNVTTVNGLAADVITAAAIAADAGTELGTAVWASAARTLTSSGFVFTQDDADLVWQSAERTLTSSGTFTQDDADLVWQSAERSLTSNVSFVFTQDDADLVWQSGERTLTGIAFPVLVLASVSGDGSIPIDHNYGGTDALRTVTAGGDPVADVTIKVYAQADFDAGRRGEAFVAARARTGTDGRWTNLLMLAAGDYKLVAFKAGAYGPDVVSLTVTA